jgi:hypothetical protein
MTSIWCIPSGFCITHGSFDTATVTPCRVVMANFKHSREGAAFTGPLYRRPYKEIPRRKQ